MSFIPDKLAVSMSKNCPFHHHSQTLYNVWYFLEYSNQSVNIEEVSE